MKARRTLDHNGVVQEVTKQLSSRFVPDPVDIKKHLEVGPGRYCSPRHRGLAEIARHTIRHKTRGFKVRWMTWRATSARPLATP